MAYIPITAGSGVNPSAAPEYAGTTVDSADWPSVPIKTYFFDLTDRLVYYKDITGTVISLYESGGGSSSGIWGISDPAGTYTYYSDIASANAAASSGQTIELFANVRETGSVVWELKAGVTYQLNGYTYTLDNASTTLNAIEDTFVTTGLTATILNGTVKRASQASPNAGAALAIYKSNAGIVFCNGVTFINEVGTAGRVVGGKLQGGIYKTTGSDITASVGLRIDAGEANNTSTYSTDGYSVYLGGGDINNSYIYSSSYRGLGIFSGNSTAGNCTVRSDGNYAIYNNSGHTLNCTAFSTATSGTFSSTANYGLNSVSTSSQGGFINGGSQNGCNFTSYANSGASITSTTAKAYNCTFYSTAGKGLDLSGSIFNCTVKSFYFNANGHGLAGGFSIGPQAVMNCTIETIFTGTFGITDIYGNSRAVRYSGNVYSGLGTFIDTTYISQALTTTPDAYGNIIDA